MKAILERRSIRKYTGEPVSDADMKDLLKAAMAAPSAHNKQPWAFIIVNDRRLLTKITEFHPYSKMLNEAPMAIIVCGDRNKEESAGYWVQDCSAATENILIAAQSKGLGTVWLGVYPVEERIDAIRKIFRIPEHIMPLNVIAVGHPAEKKQPADRYDESRIRFNKWE
ncbi:MAG: nitroreductase family protein [Gracilibacteraceae bacterium]|nr:nitroreductase family protein [Gracilibacteraceae bacterium]